MRNKTNFFEKFFSYKNVLVTHSGRTSYFYDKDLRPNEYKYGWRLRFIDDGQGFAKNTLSIISGINSLDEDDTPDPKQLHKDKYEITPMQAVSFLEEIKKAYPAGGSGSAKLVTTKQELRTRELVFEKTALRITQAAQDYVLEQVMKQFRYVFANEWALNPKNYTGNATALKVDAHIENTEWFDINEPEFDYESYRHITTGVPLPEHHHPDNYKEFRRPGKDRKIKLGKY